MQANRFESGVKQASQEEYSRNRSIDLGNELLNRAKEVSQKIEQRVRALCGNLERKEDAQFGDLG